MAQVHSDFFTFIIFLNYIQNFYFRSSKLEKQASNLSEECAVVTELIRKCVDEYADVLRVAKVNVDDEPELAMKFKVSSIPMLVLFKNGKIISTSVGYRPKDEILNELKLYMNRG